MHKCLCAAPCRPVKIWGPTSKTLVISEGAILVTADVVRLYPSVSRGAGLQPPRKRLHERKFT